MHVIAKNAKNAKLQKNPRVRNFLTCPVGLGMTTAVEV
jgi:hypothetical protein